MGVPGVSMTHRKWDHYPKSRDHDPIFSRPVGFPCRTRNVKLADLNTDSPVLGPAVYWCCDFLFPFG